MRSFIVKVQRPLAGEPKVLIYNEDRSVEQQVPMQSQLAGLFTEGEVKIYMHARMDSFGFLYLDARAPDQDW